MIEDEKLGLKIAESPEEAMRENALKSAEQRIREITFSLELENVILEYLKKTKKKII